LATEGLPACEHLLAGCELTVDVAAIFDKFSSGLAVAVTVALSCTACLEEACKRRLARCCFFLCTTFLLLGGAGRGRKLIGRKPINLVVGWCGGFLFFVVPRKFSLDAGKSNFDS